MKDKKQEKVVFMADVSGSRDWNSDELKQVVGGLLKKVNRDCKSAILSPFVTTLGDEFQGLAQTGKAAVHLMFQIEAAIREMQSPLRLRYVIYEGKIDTPINREIAYGMLGPGLTHARELLSEKKRDRDRFNIRLSDLVAENRLRRTFAILETLLKEWKTDDFELIDAMIAESSDLNLAKKLKRDRTALYRRRQTFRIADFIQLRALIYDLATRIEAPQSILEIRKMNALRQHELAKQAGLKTRQLSEIERGLQPVTFEIQRALDFGFGFDLPKSVR